MNVNIPLVPQVIDSLKVYLAEIHKIPMLTAEEEHQLAVEWYENQDINAAHRLVTSHLRYVPTIAKRYKRYGVPVSELISEGNIGLMQAVKKFNPYAGTRLATCAIWWIKGYILEYILKMCSLTKLSISGKSKKRVFFNLKKAKRELYGNADLILSEEQIDEVSKHLKVVKEDVKELDMFMSSSDASLDSSPDHKGLTYVDKIYSKDKNPEEYVIDKFDSLFYKERLSNALQILSDREKDIFIRRRLSEEPETLEEISQEYKISRERIRKIELAAFSKIKNYILGLENINT